jgi:hypothetical protein
MTSDCEGPFASIARAIGNPARCGVGALSCAGGLIDIRETNWLLDVRDFMPPVYGLSSWGIA